MVLKHGIRISYDLIEPIKLLTDVDKGQLLVAMLEYGKNGKQPQFDGILGLAWGFMKPKIDKANGIAPNGIETLPHQK